MVALPQPVSVSRGRCREPLSLDAGSDVVLSGCYRLFAVPASHTITDDVIISDIDGKPYLLSHDSTIPSPSERDMLDLLGMAFEPSQDISWHTATELHQLLYGTPVPAAAVV